VAGIVAFILTMALAMAIVLRYTMLQNVGQKLIFKFFSLLRFDISGC
jgi:hypothetical protein